MSKLDTYVEIFSEAGLSLQDADEAYGIKMPFKGLSIKPLCGHKVIPLKLYFVSECLEDDIRNAFETIDPNEAAQRWAYQAAVSWTEGIYHGRGDILDTQEVLKGITESTEYFKTVLSSLKNSIAQA